MSGFTVEDLRRYAIARSLFKPTTLPKALARLGFVQADPIRAPARAQDLTLAKLVALLAFAVPHWRHERKAALARAKARLPNATVDGVTWYWPAGENPRSRRHQVADEVRLFAPFDPVVWDRLRFELFWDWAYRFEAYTPAPKRLRGYYALPLMWRDAVVGWANLSVASGRLVPSLGYASGRPPKDPAYRRELDAELARMEAFLGISARD